jgi:hypothetical protein
VVATNRGPRKCPLLIDEADATVFSVGAHTSAFGEDEFTRFQEPEGSGATIGKN